MTCEVPKDAETVGVIEIDDKTGHVSFVSGPQELKDAVEAALANGVWRNASTFSDGGWYTSIEQIFLTNQGLNVT